MALTRDAAERPLDVAEPLLRVYVWELPVRVVHWLIFFSIVVLSFTGWYLHGPFVAARGQQAFVMATMRYVHEVAGFVFAIALLVRLYWFFVGNRWARWGAYVPFRAAHWAAVGAMLRYYLFLRWRPPYAIGHNRLAAFVYLIVYALLALQALTGFALLAWVLRTPPWMTLFGWLPGWLGIQPVRQLHYLLMFVFWAFTIHHVYSAVLVAGEERNGLIGSIVSGYKFVPAWLLRRELADAAPPPREWPARRPAPEPLPRGEPAP
ncbi:MAG TPA: Ni/Fe-hydrogenase, b-type cytochrome subunit [Chloroflexota bacterium]|nr:Ni/Fe-hydrogenase, b-type cytochrome subunit [Chloroflexota bacterium]